MAKGGCNKCTGSCACKAKKPRAKKAPAKRVIGGRAKAPQVVIMPAASITPTTAAANPYQTIVSQSTPGINKSTRGMQTMETETTERKINPSRLLNEPPKPTLVTSVVGTEAKPKKNYKSGFMSILPEAIRLENVRQRAIVKKPSMSTMETQTEPIELEVAKGGRKNLFEFQEEQKATGKRAILTNAGRPTFQASLEKALAAGPPAPEPESPE